ncbi:MAG TPA: GMC family oxidoreductase [Candidatus Methylomirabilis sp.]|nr:GMC family oxidoreductase [Candidatus Methylomirabilis sp.]
MPPSKDRVDVLVIGAGASGAAFTWSLAEAGIDALCLEQGPWTDSTTYPAMGHDWELRRQTDFHPDPNVRRLRADYPVETSGSPIDPLMYNAVGGSTIHWSAHFPRLRPSDFRVRSLDGAADDWPLTYDELEPFFDLNDRMMGVSGLVGDPAYPPKSPRQTPPIPLGTLGDTIVRGFDKLGWHWWPSDSAIITRPFEGRRACNNCGPCDLGCPIGAKASTDITYWPKAIARGAAVETGARVREITVARNGLADGVVYHDSRGEVREQKARIVVLACNGVGTPRLLLNSRSALFPDGLANGTGLVGRNLMFHPYASVRGIFPDRLEGFKGPIGCSIISQEFYETDPARGFVRGYSFQVARGLSPVATALGGLGSQLIPWGSDHRRMFDARWDRSITIAVIGDDLPEETNRVVLHPELTDSDGIAAPQVRYTLSENSRRMLDHGIARATEVLRAAGAVEVLATPLLRTAGWHLMGTARMGSDPRGSVVDGFGRCHEVKNLYIIDGSIMVTGGAVNPTSTIQALALRIADRLAREARNL